MDISEKVLAAFSAEHKEFLEGIRSLLEELATSVTPADDPRFDEMYRMAHSLKGGARVCNLRPIETLGHRLESAFEHIRRGELRLDADVAGQVNVVLDAIEDWMAALAAGETPYDPAEALAVVERLLHGADVMERSAPEADQQPNIPGISDSFWDSSGDPSPKSAPDTASVRGTGVRHQTPVAGNQANIDSVRVSTEGLNRLLRSSGQLLTATLGQNRIAQELAEVTALVEELDHERESIRKLTATGRHEAQCPEHCGPLGLPSERCPPGHFQQHARLTQYFDFTDQRLRDLRRKTGQVETLYRRSSWMLKSLGQEVQRDVRQASLVPVDSVFQGFRKMVRDLARDEDKAVGFHISGFDVKADRMVLQALKDPVMHILRNAVGHGVESPDERRSRGKPAEAKIELKIEAVGNRLKVAIVDDGRGIDLRRVIGTAVAGGLITQTEAAEKSDEELAMLIFKPGFSTSQAVTEISGRGMGLSVVCETVRRLQGEIRLPRVRGSGTTIELAVPLSVSTHRLLLIECAGQRFALPLCGICRLVRGRASDVETVEGKPVLTFEGRPVPLVWLRDVLGIDGGAKVQSSKGPKVQREETPRSFVPLNLCPSAPLNLSPHVLSIAVLRSGTAQLAVAVDAFIAETDALIHDLDGPARQLRCFSGAILQEDGSAALALNVGQLIDGGADFQVRRRAYGAKVQRGRGSQSDLCPSDPLNLSMTRFQDGPDEQDPLANEQTKKTVLIVDDSFTTRTLEKSILEAHGYDVRIAVDGLEALTQLRSGGAPVDLVISDVEMPRMDGFELLEAMKQEEPLSRIPVIVVTSRSRQEDRQRGLSLGADAYIVKQKFDHEDLMATIRQII